jgi:hypothetical protein
MMDGSPLAAASARLGVTAAKVPITKVSTINPTIHLLRSFNPFTSVFTK